MTVEQGHARIVGEKIDFDFLIAADHDYIFRSHLTWAGSHIA